MSKFSNVTKTSKTKTNMSGLKLEIAESTTHAILRLVRLKEVLT